MLQFETCNVYIICDEYRMNLIKTAGESSKGAIHHYVIYISL